MLDGAFTEGRKGKSSCRHHRVTAYIFWMCTVKGLVLFYFVQKAHLQLQLCFRGLDSDWLASSLCARLGCNMLADVTDRSRSPSDAGSP